MILVPKLHYQNNSEDQFPELIEDKQGCDSSVKELLISAGGTAIPVTVLLIAGFRLHKSVNGATEAITVLGSSVQKLADSITNLVHAQNRFLIAHPNGQAHDERTDARG